MNNNRRDCYRTHSDHASGGKSKEGKLVLRPGAAPGYCVGLITPASLAGPIAVRSPQFGGGICRILRVLRRQQWVEDFRYVALAISFASYAAIGIVFPGSS